MKSPRCHVRLKKGAEGAAREEQEMKQEEKQAGEEKEETEEELEEEQECNLGILMNLNTGHGNGQAHHILAKNSWTSSLIIHF